MLLPFFYPTQALPKRMKLLNLDGKDSDSPIKLELKVIKEANSNKGKKRPDLSPGHYLRQKPQ